MSNSQTYIPQFVLRILGRIKIRQSKQNNMKMFNGTYNVRNLSNTHKIKELEEEPNTSNGI
ncbi:hypothetical protein FQR65_LT06077 [Abscondita terminalis]|nr:hypothetical protein FQR65_LT06077 [Abscondita terminalis]